MKETLTPGAIEGRITAPASKSYAQRALAAALLVPRSNDPARWSELRNMGLCNDTSAALDVIRRLGAEVLIDRDTYRVQGGFLRQSPTELNIGEAGLSARLFTPIAAQSPRPITVSGHGSILKRPVATTMTAPLHALGATVRCTGDGYLPLTVCGPLRGGTVEVDGSLSSQFITGLLMASPLSAEDTHLVVRQPKSIPYLAMTLEVLRAFGISVSHAADYTEFIIRGSQQYQPATYSVEGDWSGASCLLVAGAVASAVGSGVTVDNLNPRSLQADRAMVDALTRAGATMEQTGVDEVTSMEKDAAKLWFTSLTSGIVVGIDKIIMLIALVVFRIGWWATIYCQQILLGMLTIFGPIQWAFSLLPKWEGAWAKWLTRYLTVHFYGAMLYFVGFYVLLLFDIVLCIQVENLTAITASEQTMAAYLQNSFFSAGYLMAASIVALKCLNLVPDLAAWMIPEGDTAFSTRNFGEGVAQQAKMTATGAIGTMTR